MTKSTINQKGFTLIELMIALFLGMLIMAAVSKVYIMSARTAITQQAGSSILDANVFGLQQIERNLRLAGLDTAAKSSAQTPFSGIITDVSNIGNGKVTFNNQGFTADMVTRGEVTNYPTAVNRAGSDQLTIQYRAPTDILDCEGDLALGPKRATVYDEEGVIADTVVPVEGQIVVERYFLKDKGNGELELRCDAGRYAVDKIASYETPLTPEQQAAHDRVDKIAPNFSATNTTPPIQVEGMGDDGQVIISNIDDFRLQLAIANGNNVQYITPAQYDASAKDKAIIAVKTAILVRGEVPSVLNDVPNDPTFIMLGDENVKLKASTPKGYIRRVYESNSMLRNSREKK